MFRLTANAERSFQSKEKSHIDAMPTLTKVPFIKENELLGDPDPGSNTEGFIPLPDDRLIPQAGLEEHLSGQLDVRRLNAIHDRLWRAGLPGKVHPLHHQIVLQRNIIVTERVDLHLVWYVQL